MLKRSARSPIVLRAQTEVVRGRLEGRLAFVPHSSRPLAAEHLVNPHHPDLDAPYQVEGIGGSVLPANLELSLLDEAEPLTGEAGFATTGRLWAARGWVLGDRRPAALRVAARGGLDGPVVALLGDGWDRYRDRPCRPWPA